MNIMSEEELKKEVVGINCIYYVESKPSKKSWLEDDFEKELYKEYYTQLRSGDTNMGYEQWKLTSEVLNNE